MRHRLSRISVIAVACLLFASVATAGWTDAAKQAGTTAINAGVKSGTLSAGTSDTLAGIKEVLSLGTEYATSSLSQPGSFSSNPLSSFSLPSGLSGLADSADLLGSLNTAAERSVPATGDIFMDAIRNLTIGDPSALLGGGNNAITRYFENTSRGSLKTLITPVVRTSVESAGIAPSLAALGAGMGDTAFDPVDFVADRVLDGMFALMAEKEASLRSTGGQGASELIKQLF